MMAYDLFWREVTPYLSTRDLLNSRLVNWDFNRIASRALERPEHRSKNKILLLTDRAIECFLLTFPHPTRGLLGFTTMEFKPSAYAPAGLERFGSLHGKSVQFASIHYSAMVWPWVAESVESFLRFCPNLKALYVQRPRLPIFTIGDENAPVNQNVKSTMDLPWFRNLNEIGLNVDTTWMGLIQALVSKCPNLYSISYPDNDMELREQRPLHPNISKCLESFQAFRIPFTLVLTLIVDDQLENSLLQQLLKVQLNIKNLWLFMRLDHYDDEGMEDEKVMDLTRTLLTRWLGQLQLCESITIRELDLPAPLSLVLPSCMKNLKHIGYDEPNCFVPFGSSQVPRLESANFDAEIPFMPNEVFTTVKRLRVGTWTMESTNAWTNQVPNLTSLTLTVSHGQEFQLTPLHQLEHLVLRFDYDIEPEEIWGILTGDSNPFMDGLTPLPQILDPEIQPGEFTSPSFFYGLHKLRSLYLIEVHRSNSLWPILRMTCTGIIQPLEQLHIDFWLRQESDSTELMFVKRQLEKYHHIVQLGQRHPHD